MSETLFKLKKKKEKKKKTTHLITTNRCRLCDDEDDVRKTVDRKQTKKAKV